jgi:hypothetical protein
MSDHNEIAFAFIKSLRPLLIKPGEESFKEIMTTYESISFGVMVLLKDVYGAPPHEATRLVDLALGQAIARFAADNNKENRHG